MYDGQTDGAAAPYTESSAASPVNAYGRTKLDFEQALAQRRHAVVLRSSLILGPPTPEKCRKQSFLQFCDGKFADGCAADFYVDEYRSVVHVADVVEVIRRFVHGGATTAPGVYNMGGPERVNRYEVALAVCRHRGYDVTLARRAHRSAISANLVPSPPDITMDSSRVAEVTGLSFATLDEMVRRSFA